MIQKFIFENHFFKWKIPHIFEEKKIHFHKKSQMRKISRLNLEKRLEKGPVKFEFDKLDGCSRIALGTTCLTLIPEKWHPKASNKAHLGTPFFDLELNEWRAVSVLVTHVYIINKKQL